MIEFAGLDRLPDWEGRLNAFLADRAGVVFGYDHATAPDRYDCCAFAGGAVLAITGIDAMAEFRGRYTTRIGAARALRRYGRGSVATTLDDKFTARPRAFARRGDLVAIAGDTIGVCVGAEAVFVGEEDGAPGLVRFGRGNWVACWSVG